MTERRLTPGFRVGHWTDPEAGTGCTVVLAPQGTVGSYDIRGASPSTREIAHLHPDTKLTEVNAVVLSGGSAYGLAAADGVMEWLEERGQGYSTPVGVVPIVAAAVIFDLAATRSDVRPGPRSGRAACDAAADDVATGRVGAGTGATVGKWGGFENAASGGFGFGSARDEDLEVRAIAVVNAVGDVIDDEGRVLAGTSSPEPSLRRRVPEQPSSTVLAVVTTETPLGKRACRWIAARASDGITISVRPAHTRYDGDIVFALASSPAGDASEVEPVELDVLGHLATSAVAAAVRDAVAT
jgi:L-aminopeptidase/D-esterase-like protein